MNGPLITVLAIAYNRREFIDSAILSAIDQTLPKGMYEIVLLTNFDIDPEIVEKGRVRVFYSDVRELGPKIAEVLPHCQGDIISFLEDDDLWLAEKLVHVKRVFDSLSDICYYHNNWAVIDSEGRAVSHPIHIQGRRKIISEGQYSVAGRKASYADIRKAVHLTGDFNGSSISIKKSVLINYIDYLRQITFSPDSFFFYSSLSSGGILYIDREVLTKYRIHHKNISRRVSGSADALTDPTHQVILQMLSSFPGNEAAIKSIKCQVSDIAIESLWIWGFRSRGRALKLALNHLKYVSRYELGYDVLLLMFSFLYLLSPRIATSIYSQIYYHE